MKIKPKTIVDVFKNEYSSTPERRVALQLIDLGVTQENFYETIDHCKLWFLPDPIKNDVHNEIRHIEMGLEPTRGFFN